VPRSGLVSEMMDARAFAALSVVATWWAATGVVLRIVWLRASATRWTMSLATVLGSIALGVIASSAWRTSALAAYVSFAAALVLWAWHELAFLLGVLTGPIAEPCPPELRGVKRFVRAAGTVIHHEVGLAATQLAIVVFTWGAPNQTAAWIFGVLFVMRLSAKLNVFLGVRNLTEEFVPPHLKYLLTYFRRARLNALMPVSLVASSLATACIAATSPVSGDRIASTLVATLLALATLEHVFLVIPLPDALLWRWILPSKPARGAAS